MRTRKKRKKQGKTNYRLRLKLLKSGKPRIVIRKTNKYFIVQAVESDEARDKIIKGVNSKELLKHGWNEKFKGSLKSVPAGYLTGLFFAKKMKKGDFILDLGLARKIQKNRIYSVVKGLIDGGLNIKADKKIFPGDERISGSHLKEGLKEIIQKTKLNLEKIK
jgi:large subunit ribosomal protein L18